MIRKDTRFNRHSYSELTEKLPSGTLSHPEARGIWEFMNRCDDPSDVARTYRSYRDSHRCNVPRPSLRAMRDAIINSMREMNKKDPKPRVQKQIGNNVPRHNDGWQSQRTSA
jgi:hypothetical protein